MKTTNGKLHYGFILVVGLFLLQFPASLIMSAGGIFLTPVSEDFGVTVSALGFATSMIQIAMFVLMTSFGKICSKYKMSLVLSVCLLIEAASFAIRAVSNNIYVFYATSVLLAAPMGIFFSLSLPKLINAWFPYNSATIIGVCACAQGLGGMLFSSVGGAIIENYGWRPCYWLWVVISLALLPVTLFIVKDQPADKGLKPFGYEKHQNTQADDNVKTVKVVGLDYKKALRCPAFWMITIGIPLSAAVAMSSIYISSYCISLGLSVSAAGIFAGTVQGGNMAYKLMLGPVTDKSVRGGAFFYIGSTILCFLLLLFGKSSVVMLVAGCFLFGSVYSAQNLFGPSITRYVFGDKDLMQIWALTSSIIQIVAAFGTTGWGIVAENFGYDAVFWGGIGLSLVFLTLFLCAIGMRDKIKEQWTEAIITE